MEDKINAKATFQEVLASSKITYRRHFGPTGWTMDLDIPYHGTYYLIKASFDERNNIVRYVRIESERPVDPGNFYEVARLVRRIRHVGKSLFWETLDTGHYVIQSNSYFLGQFEKLPDLFQEMIKKYLVCEPIIEDFAHGRKDLDTALNDLRLLKVYRDRY